MRLPKPLLLPTLVIAITACAPNQTEPTEVPGASDRPQAVRALLEARHAADLPTLETLERHPDAAETLRRLATTDPSRVVRVRALLLLLHFPTAENRAVLIQTSDDSAQPPAIRAAALRAMAGFDPASDRELWGQLTSSQNSSDPRIATAASTVLHQARQSTKTTR